MTNRDKFNKEVRSEIERQLEYWESLTNEEFYDLGESLIRLDVRGMLNLFWGDETGKFLGSRKEMIHWLSEEV